MRTLTEIANYYELDKGTLDKTTTLWYNNYPDHETLGYSEIYDIYMRMCVNNVKKFLEIGIADPRFPGASLKMWYEYFPNAQIYGIDNFWGNIDRQNECKKYQNERTIVEFVDQSSRDDMQWFFATHGSGFDFIVEDGAHWPSHMMISLVCCFSHLKSGGIYFIEDLQSTKSVGRAAYNNLQITEAFQEFISVGELPRLYITKNEHQALLDQINYVKMFKRKDNYLLAIFKK